MNIFNITKKNKKNKKIKKNKKNKKLSNIIKISKPINISNSKKNAGVQHIIIDSFKEPPSIDNKTHQQKDIRVGELPRTIINPPYNPQQIRQAYEVEQITPIKSKPKVGIIGCYYYSDIQRDFDTWTNHFGLPRKTLVINANGVGPASGQNKGWYLELQLDIQSVYTICQNCDIHIYLAKSASFLNIKSAISLANSHKMDVISMSFGSSEMPKQFLNSSSSLESVLTSSKCCYLASTGDSSFPSYPALNPNVLAIGGTTLNLDLNEGSGIVTRLSEKTWNSAGAGYSNIYPKPKYQNGIQSITKNKRAIPDISGISNPETGVYVYCSKYNVGTNWYHVGGTSLSCPLTAGLIANSLIIRFNNSKGNLTTVANLSNDVHKIIYDRYKLNTTTFYTLLFYDVEEGLRDNGYKPGSTYDIPTGLGVPLYGKLANYLGNF